MNLKHDIENHTLDELKEMYKLPKTKIKKMLEEQGLEIKYCGRTPYTNQLIPVSDEVVAKYSNKKKRDKTNEIMMSDMDERNWPQCEIDRRYKDIEHYDHRIGVLLYKINQKQKDINDLVQHKVNQQFMISIGKKTIETKDYCAYVEEERYGKRPEITKFDMSLINDDMVLGYLSQKLSPVSLMYLSKALKD